MSDAQDRSTAAHTSSPTDDRAAGGDPRSAGITILVGAALIVAVIATHPIPHAHAGGGMVEAIRQTAHASRVVHAVAIVASCLLLIGFWGLAAALDLRRTVNRAGLVAFALGSLAMIAAALINGFAVVSIVELRGADEPAVFEKLHPQLALCRILNQTCTQVGVVASSIALLCWSITLLRRGGLDRAIGAFGVLAGVIPAAAMLHGTITMNLHGLAMVVLPLALWSAACAVRLIQRKL
ncbi:MAG: hypothetical protein ACKVS9_06970 [Phycisphaerae bacterium]